MAGLAWRTDAATPDEVPARLVWCPETPIRGADPAGSACSPARDRAIFVAKRGASCEFPTETPLDGDAILRHMSSGTEPGSTRRRAPSCQRRWINRLGAGGRDANRGDRALQEDRVSVFQDRTLTCRDCAGEFTFSSGEQAFFASKGLLNDPQRCPACRAVAKRARTVGGPREFHAAICGSCGGQAMVPFAPRNDRPVYCSTCFDKVRAGTASEAPVTA
jgi:CxxC-x17-CxxC domain-containing protein